tara:strand:+ start:2804 stop:3133 length:330 start_codon:yes stop_codon:yes gene_type:complete
MSENLDMPMSLEQLQDELDELSSADDFLDHFGIRYSLDVVQVNRLHIMQRFHDYLVKTPLEPGVDAFTHYGRWLEQAYMDFVDSSAQEQKVLRVFKAPEPGFVSADDFL